MDNIRLPHKLEIDEASGRDIQKRFKLPHTEFGPESVYRLFDPADNSSWGYVVIDNRTRGPGLGGIRLAPDVTVEEVYGLASAMTFKNAAARLPLGGGKSGIIGDPRVFSENPLQKRKLMAMVADAIWQISDYIPGPDMGTDENDMQVVYDVFTEKNGSPNHGRGGVGRPREKGGLPIDEWGITAHGLFAAAQEAEKHLADFKIDGARVVVQGLGNVGFHIARKLSEKGARIVGASDINCGLFNPDGLDLAELGEIRRERFGLMRYTGPTGKRYIAENLDEVLHIPCDILVPAARPHAIHHGNAGFIDARILLQGANNPVDAVTEYFLQHRKGVISLTDFIVNSGGVVACAVERKIDMDLKFRDRVLKLDGVGRKFLEDLAYRIVSENVAEIFGRVKAHKEKDITWREVAMELPKERLRTGAAVIPELA